MAELGKILKVEKKKRAAEVSSTSPLSMRRLFIIKVNKRTDFRLLPCEIPQSTFTVFEMKYELLHFESSLLDKTRSNTVLR
jgi:hypothetical protein